VPELVRPYPQLPFNPPASTLAAVLFGVTIVAALYFGREVLVPIALAILLSFILAPLVRIAQRLRIPRILAVLAVVALAFAIILGLGAVMVAQVNQLAGDLPRYEATLRDKIQSFRGIIGGSGTLERAAEVLQDLGKEIDKPRKGEGAAPIGGQPVPQKPIPVEVRQPDPGALQTIVSVITPLLSPLTTTGIVFIFVIFILMQREDLRNRLVRLAGVRDLQRTTAALDDAGQRLSRLFLTQLALNAAFGLVIGTGLWIIGVPSAPLWGIMAMVLRFVPYIGAVLAAVFPIVLAAAVGPGWTMVLWTGALFLVVEPVVGHVIEPLLYGQSSGLSPIAIVVSATFWTWLWGPIGLVLATPLTICVMVLGRHVDRLKFLDVMFSDQAALTPAELVYQRMLAGDSIEAAEQAQTYLKDKPLVAYYEDVLIEGLKLAQSDANRGELDEARTIRIRDAVAEIVEDLSTHTDKPAKPAEADDDKKEKSRIEEADDRDEAPAPMEFREEWRGEKPVLCVPGLGPLDESLALVIAQLLERRGLGARAEPADALSVSRIFSLDTTGVAFVCLCYVESANQAHIRYAVRRLRRKLPEAPILIALFGENSANDPEQGKAALPNTSVASRSLSAVIEQIVAASGARAAPEQALPRVAEKAD
jgi:predicted PurR-regulated permease PerM